MRTQPYLKASGRHICIIFRGKEKHILPLSRVACSNDSSKDQLTPVDSKNKLQATSCVMNVITKTKISLSLSLISLISLSPSSLIFFEVKVKQDHHASALSLARLKFVGTIHTCQFKEVGV